MRHSIRLLLIQLMLLAAADCAAADAPSCMRPFSLALHEHGLLYSVKTDADHGMIIEPFDYSQVESDAIRNLTSIIDTSDDSIPHGLIMSRNSIPLKEQEKWRALVNNMPSDGTVPRIFEKYFKPDLARSMVNF